MENNMLKQYKNVPVLDLIRYKSNSRTHSGEQVQKLVRSIKEFGFTNPLLIDEFNVIIAGHGRLDAALAAGITEVPCIVLPALTEAQKAALVIADNKIALDAGKNLLVKTQYTKKQENYIKIVDTSINKLYNKRIHTNTGIKKRPYITNADNGTPYKILSRDKNGVKYERFVRNFDSISELNYKLGEILDLVGYLDCKAGTDESCYKGRGFGNYNVIKAEIITIEKLED